MQKQHTFTMNKTITTHEKLIVLVLYAIPAERIDLPPHPYYQYIYVETGIGKVKAALAAQAYLLKHKVSAVINIGSCGSIHHPIGSVHTCAHFVDRDMEKLKTFGLPCEISFTTQDIRQYPLFKVLQLDKTCNTGDSFLTDTTTSQGDVFDMEAYAIAHVCQSYNMPFVAIKCVSDIIGQNSVKHWEDKLAEVRRSLQHFVEQKHF